MIYLRNAIWAYTLIGLAMGALYMLISYLTWRECRRDGCELSFMDCGKAAMEANSVARGRGLSITFLWAAAALLWPVALGVLVECVVQAWRDHTSDD